MRIAVNLREGISSKLKFVFAALIQVMLMSSLAAAQVSVPLTIQEMKYPAITGVARTSEPVTAGIPLAKGAVPCASANPASCSGISSLGLTGATMGQFRCLVEWEDQSCKWVLVDTQATVAARWSASRNARSTARSQCRQSNRRRRRTHAPRAGGQARHTDAALP